MRTKQQYLGLLLCLLSAVSWAGVDVLTTDHPTEPVAMISGFHGKIILKSGKRKLDLFDELQPGEIILVPKGSNLTVIYYKSGIKYLVSGMSEIRVGSGKLEVVAGNPVSSTRTPYRKRMKIRPAGLAQASASMSARIGRPGQKIYLGLTPEIRLHVIRVEPRAVFELYTSAGKPVWKKPLTLNGYPLKLRIDASAGLERGKVYTWLVYRKAPEKVVIARGTIRLANAALVQKARLRRPAYDSDMSDKVLYATWLESVGAVDDAARYWRMLASKYNSNRRLTELAR